MGGSCCLPTSLELVGGGEYGWQLGRGGQIKDDGAPGGELVAGAGEASFDHSALVPSTIAFSFLCRNTPGSGGRLGDGQPSHLFL